MFRLGDEGGVREVEIQTSEMYSEFSQRDDASLFECLISLWELCNSERSHICEVSVPLLLRCIGLPSGSDAFWKVIQHDFHHVDWRVRFTAGELPSLLASLEHLRMC